MNKGKIVAAVILSVIFGIFINPLAEFGLGCLIGVFVKIFIGNYVETGLNLLHIPASAEQIPILFGTIALVTRIISNASQNLVNIKEKKKDPFDF